MARSQLNRGLVGTISSAALRLEQLAVDEYVEAVLPHSASLWAGQRTFERYAGDLRTFASSGYGRRRFKLLGLRVDGTIASSCKGYERELRCGERILRATGIGAVFTRESFRGQGLATALLAAILDTQRAAGTDVVYLFSDIRPHFYEEIGFEKLPSRIFTLRADALESARVEVTAIEDRDWPGLARCFSTLEARRPFALRRTPLVWEMIRARHTIAPATGSIANLAIRSRDRILAYCLGTREVQADAYVVDEFGFAGDAHRALVGPLLRAAAGDLRKITGWLPPPVARGALPRGTVRARRDAILMIAPLSATARTRWKAEKTDILRETADMVWSTDHV